MSMKKIFSLLLRSAVYAVAAILIGLSLGFAVLQTKWARSRLQDFVVKTAETQGVHVEIAPIEGRIPFHWNLKKLSFTIPEIAIVDIENIKVRLALLPLFRQEIAISYFHAGDAHVTLLQPPEPLTLPVVTPSHVDDFKQTLTLLSIIRIQSASVDRLIIANPLAGYTSEFSMITNAKYRHRGKKFSLRTKLISNDSDIEFSVIGDRRAENIVVAFDANLESLKLLRPFYYFPFDLQGALHLTLQGPWNTWTTFFGSNKLLPGLMPLHGKATMALNTLSVPNAEVLNQKWEGFATIKVQPDRSIELKESKVSSSLGTITGEASFDSSFILSLGKLSIKLPDLKPLSVVVPINVKGSALGTVFYEHNIFSASINAEPLTLEDFIYSSAHLNLNATKEDNRWEGKLSLEAFHPTLPLSAQGAFAFASIEDITIEKLHIHGPDLECYGDLQYRPKDSIVEGSLYAQVKHLHRFQDFFKHTYVEGSMGLQAVFTSANDPSSEIPIQDLNLHAVCKNLRYNEIYAEEVLINADLKSLFINPKGSLIADARKVYLPYLFFNSFSFSLKNEGTSWPFSLYADGRWKDPFEFACAGAYAATAKGWNLSIDKLQGEALSKTFQLTERALFVAEEQTISLSPFFFQMAEGALTGSYSLSPEAFTLNVHAQHFPIDFVSLPLPHFSLRGTAAINVSLDVTKENALGSMQFTLENAQLTSSDLETPFQAKGAFQAHLDRGTAQMHAHFVASNQQFFDWTGTFPVRCGVGPLSFALDKELPLSSELTMEGNLEEVFDFINFGTHRFSGLLSAHLILSKTLAHPSLNGEFEVQDGTYENYLTGTTLKKLESKFLAQNDKIEIASISASDGSDGLVKGEGRVLLYPSEHYPYVISLVLKNLNALRYDALTANFTGPMHVEGNSQSAKATGDLRVAEADLYIPDDLPVDIPVIPFHFIHQPGHLKFMSQGQSKIFPLHLDLNLDASGDVNVKGKGLESKWEGTVHATGTNANLLLDGKLNLKKGSFSFSGKTFELTHGEITFSDKAKQSSFLSITGLLNLPELTVTAILRGPLESPTLTFQSSPPQPTSTILAYILFNKDLSDINPLQALQIAQTIVNLSGGAGPGMLEQIRKSIGVDRLSIIAGPGGLDDLSVQIGKYLMRGVMITLSQGSGASRVIVEVELAKGFIFQAETQIEEEGKFSLKWNRNY